MADVMKKALGTWVAASKILGRDVSTSEPYPVRALDRIRRRTRKTGWPDEVLSYQPDDAPSWNPPSWPRCRVCDYPLDPAGNDGSGTHPTCGTEED